MKLRYCMWAAVLSAATAMGQTLSSGASGEMTGKCTYYARSHDGHTTASGEKFDSKALTAAHRKLPMGTKLKVTNLDNGKSVVVTVNDRGPFAKGRSLSVTRRAAEELGFVKEGVAKVKMEKVE